MRDEARIKARIEALNTLGYCIVKCKFPSDIGEIIDIENENSKVYIIAPATEEEKLAYEAILRKYPEAAFDFTPDWSYYYKVASD